MIPSIVISFNCCVSHKRLLMQRVSYFRQRVWFIFNKNRLEIWKVDFSDIRNSQYSFWHRSNPMRQRTKLLKKRQFSVALRTAPGQRTH